MSDESVLPSLPRKSPLFLSTSKGSNRLSGVRGLMKKPTGPTVKLKNDRPELANLKVFSSSGVDITPKPLSDQRTWLTGETAEGVGTALHTQSNIYVSNKSEKVSKLSEHRGSFDDEYSPQVDSNQLLVAVVEEVDEVEKDEETNKILDADLNEIVELIITETDTIWILNLAGKCVSQETEEAARVEEQNQKYKELLKSKVGSENFMDKNFNTFNEPVKHKDIQSLAIDYETVSTQVTSSNLYDALLELARYKKSTNQRVHSKDDFQRGEDEAGEIMDQADDLNDGSAKDLSGLSMKVKTEAEILKNPMFDMHLLVMERSLNLKLHHDILAGFKGLPILPKEALAEDSEKNKKDAMRSASMLAKELLAKRYTQVDPDTGLKLLWTYNCPLTDGHNISSMSWNKANFDILAVGYCQFDYTKQKPGFICCWSVKNIGYPERIYKTPVGVSSVSFCKNPHPYLLGVGLYSGVVAVYNVGIDSSEPIFDSFNVHGGHSGPVWKVKWIRRNDDDCLMSVGSDGHVCQWTMKTGLRCKEMMKLNHLTGKPTSEKKMIKNQGKVQIANHDGGLCFDFNETEPELYVVGTEDGCIHKCSCWYPEQYLETYLGHTGPVYQLNWSPFDSSIFVSCSADWSIKMWHQDSTKSVLNFLSTNPPTCAAVNTCWSPQSSTVLACAFENEIQIWDLEQNLLDPIFRYAIPTNTKLTCVKFSLEVLDTNIVSIVVGDSDGVVSVYQVFGLQENDESKDQPRILENVIRTALEMASQLQGMSLQP